MTNFTIATWNVNSLRVRLPHVIEWLSTAKPDVIALQETKLMDADFPAAAFQDVGYGAIYAGQRTYNGVAILSRHKINESDIVTDVPELIDPQRRILCATINNIRIINLYVPNGQAVGSEKYQYKLSWLNKVKNFLKSELTHYSKVVVLGDFNIAPQPIDVHDPSAWEGKVLFSDEERSAFDHILSLGFTDLYRALSPKEKQYTWWDYRLLAFRRNHGLRIDHILASNKMLAHCKTCTIDKAPRKWERPSDHAPVLAEFKL